MRKVRFSLSRRACSRLSRIVSDSSSTSRILWLVIATSRSELANCSSKSCKRPASDTPSRSASCNLERNSSIVAAATSDASLRPCILSVALPSSSSNRVTRASAAARAACSCSAAATTSAISCSNVCNCSLSVKISESVDCTLESNIFCFSLAALMMSSRPSNSTPCSWSCSVLCPNRFCNTSLSAESSCSLCPKDCRNLQVVSSAVTRLC
mmetsp:Transcript_38998/g.103031  ORF Transcript_38998/g.103031 Transcript_38998/m.103031 type:complete len:211 (-) Transcript_38998:3093-3725(-)